MTTLPPMPELLSAKLRHAYELLKAGHCGDQATFADGLIAPVRGDFYAAYAYVKRNRVHIGHYRSIQLATAARAEYLSKHGISAPVVPTLSQTQKDQA